MRDKAAFAVGISAILTLASVSFVFCPVAKAAPPAAAPAASAAPAAYDDGDGDELLEHWGDPKYAHEERVQIAGLSAVLVCLGAAGVRRRRSWRKQPAHE